ncbi:hypothetical protein M5K25_017241 [Dendrobium thyrsiflorum]|uniref:Uncharacterized protein n=1 Tax=Dendrobium thyrsiflorum TaxID=117978 RepID=A0ABD0ULQ3_DENTH
MPDFHLTSDLCRSSANPLLDYQSAPELPSDVEVLLNHQFILIDDMAEVNSLFLGSPASSDTPFYLQDLKIDDPLPEYSSFDDAFDKQIIAFGVWALEIFSRNRRAVLPLELKNLCLVFVSLVRDNQGHQDLSSVYLVRGGSSPNLIERSLSKTMSYFVQEKLINLGVLAIREHTSSGHVKSPDQRALVITIY